MQVDDKSDEVMMRQTAKRLRNVEEEEEEEVVQIDDLDLSWDYINI